MAYNRGVICFVEVRTRRGAGLALAKESINEAKQRRLSRLAVHFLKQRHLLDKKTRFDVVTIGESQDKESIDLTKNAFEQKGKFVY